MEATNRIRFRVLLPVFFTGLSIALRVFGQLQLSKFQETLERTSYEETLRLSRELPHRRALAHLKSYRRSVGAPVRELFATAWSVDNAINAPAWAAAINMPFFPRAEGTYWGGVAQSVRRYSYWLFVASMWFLFGYWVDRWRDGSRIGNSYVGTWRRRLVRALGVLCGLFLCYWAWEYWFDRWELGPWLPDSLFGWSAGLIFAGLYPYSRSRSRIWSLFFGTMGVLVGARTSWYGLLYYSGFLARPGLQSLALVILPPRLCVGRCSDLGRCAPARAQAGERVATTNQRYDSSWARRGYHFCRAGRVFARVSTNKS